MKTNRIKRLLSSELIMLVLYVILLQYCYINIQVIIFEYVGYSYTPDTFRNLIGWGIIISSYYLIKYKECNLYSLFIYVIYFVSLVPFIVIYQYDEKLELWMVLLQVITIVITRFMLRGVGDTGVAVRYRYNYEDKRFRSGIIIFIGLFFLYKIATCGIPTFEQMLFENVYDTRADADDSVLLTVVQNLICRIVNPLIILIAIDEKKKFVILFIAIVQVYTYAVTGFKTFLFIPFLSLGLKYMPSLNLNKVIVTGPPLVLAGVVVLFKVTGNTMLCALMSDRVFFFPAFIKYTFFDYFTDHEYVYFSQNSFCKIFGIKSNYDTFVPNIIGAEYFDKPEMMTNTGYMADAYSNLGVWGVILMSYILIIVIRYSQKRFNNVPNNLKAAIAASFIIYYHTLNDGHVINILFTGGMLFVVMIVSFIDFRKRNG